MFEQQQSPVGFAHAFHFVQCCDRVEVRTRRQRGDDGIESMIGEVEMFDIALAQIDFDVQLRACSRAMSSITGLTSTPVMCAAFVRYAKLLP